MLPIRADLGGRSATREEVREWERRRALKVARRLEVPTSAGLGIDDLSAQIVDRKLEIGHTGIETLLRRELQISALTAKSAAVASRGGRRACSIELRCEVGRADSLPGWYADRVAANDERAVLAACPDHYLSRTLGDGSQELIETTGGSPLAIRMHFDDNDTTSIRTPMDDTFPAQWTAAARSADGTPIGGIRHQFRDEPGGGFRARLTVEFPWVTLPHMITAHRWHLACEFSNWIEALNEN